MQTSKKNFILCNHKPYNTHSYFSLIELMVVLVISGIMMAIAAPVVTKFAIGKGVESAVRIINSQILLSRQYAITNRVKVALIMPGGTSTTLPAKYKYSSARAAVVSGHSSPYTFVRWIEPTWQFLPIGASIMEVDIDKGIATGATYLKDPVDDSIVEVSSVPLASLGGGTGMGIRSIVFYPSGKVKVASGSYVEVTIGDAIYNGVWIVKNPDTDPTTNNKSCANQYNISVNKYTGRTEILTPEDYL